jgi:hypothetical protein
MRLTLALLACSAAAAADRTCEALPPLTTTRPKPSVDGGSNLFIGGARKPWDGRVAEVTSPVFDEATGAKAVLGRLAQGTSGSNPRVPRRARKNEARRNYRSAHVGDRQDQAGRHEGIR